MYTYFPKSLRELIALWAPSKFSHFKSAKGYLFTAGDFEILVKTHKKDPEQVTRIEVFKNKALMTNLCWKSGESLESKKLKAIESAFEAWFLGEDGMYESPLNLSLSEEQCLTELASARGVSKEELARDILIASLEKIEAERKISRLGALKVQLETIYERFYDSSSFDPDEFANHILGCIAQVNFMLSKEPAAKP